MGCSVRLGSGKSGPVDSAVGPGLGPMDWTINQGHTLKLRLNVKLDQMLQLGNQTPNSFLKKYG